MFNSTLEVKDNEDPTIKAIRGLATLITNSMLDDQ
jgi:hypothetical protein|tara:strand:- start:295 stop:399 length:105 start_codon:yes stop_codon:yes gene_type:complete